MYSLKCDKGHMKGMIINHGMDRFSKALVDARFMVCQRHNNSLVTQPTNLPSVRTNAADPNYFSNYFCDTTERNSLVAAKKLKLKIPSGSNNLKALVFRPLPLDESWVEIPAGSFSLSLTHSLSRHDIKHSVCRRWSRVKIFNLSFACDVRNHF